ncbi:hypothetical protein AAHE18_13G260500 [Arachis hypogaea]
MGKKRKSVATRLDEVDRTMYSTFCTTANSLSHLYTHAMNQQKLSFQAGERHALEKMYQWIIRQQQEGTRVTTGDIVAQLQVFLNFGAEESPGVSRQPLHQQNTQAAMHANFGSTLVGQGMRSAQPDQQPKNSVFSNALSSPIRRSLQPYHLAQGAALQITYPSGQNRDTNSSTPVIAWTCMLMIVPAHDFPY